MSLLTHIAQAVIDGRESRHFPPSSTTDGVQELVSKAIKDKMAPELIIEQGLIAGMDVVGERFRTNQLWIPQVMLAARAMKAGMELLRPLLTARQLKPVGTFIVGTVRGDQHDIGKNLVAMMIEGAGFEVVDLGINVAPEKFLSTLDERAAEQNLVVGLSALLTITMPVMGEIIELLKRSGADAQVKIIVGGAPLTPEFAEKIGADAYAPDAASAVLEVKKLVGVKS